MNYHRIDILLTDKQIEHILKNAKKYKELTNYCTTERELIECYVLKLVTKDQYKIFK